MNGFCFCVEGTKKKKEKLLHVFASLLLCFGLVDAEISDCFT